MLRCLRQPALLLALAVLPLCLSCFEQDPVTCWQYDVGAVEGYVTVCGEGVPIHVWAKDPSGYNLRLAETVSDSTGYYRLEVPSGLVKITLPVYFGGSTPSDHDTVRVARNVVRFDIDRSEAEITLRMPPEFETLNFTLDLDSPDGFNMSEFGQVEDGVLSCSFTGVIPDAYTMSLSHFYPRFTLTGDEGADTLHVESSAPAVLDYDMTRRYGSISGTFTGSSAEMQSDYPYIFSYSADSTRIACHFVPEDSAFTCHYPLAEPVKLLAVSGDVQRWVGGDGFAEATLFDLRPGDRISGVEYAESGLEVWLSGPGDNTDFDASVLLVDDAGETVADYLSYGNDNPIRITNLGPGRYYLRIYHDNGLKIWAPQWYGGSETPDGAAPIDLAEGELRRLEMAFVAGGVISGKVLMSGGDKSGGERDDFIQCALFDADGERVGAWRYAPDGEFVFRGLANGTHYLAARRNQGAAWWFSGTSAFESATPIVIANHAEVTGVSWAFSDSQREVGP